MTTNNDASTYIEFWINDLVEGMHPERSNKFFYAFRHVYSI